MGYKVAIRKNETGEVHMYHIDTEWEHGDGYTDFFWWADGNFSCDCNREMSFERAAFTPEELAARGFLNDYDAECSGGRFTVLYAELEDGTRVPIEDEADEPIVVGGAS